MPLKGPRQRSGWEERRKIGPWGISPWLNLKSILMRLDCEELGITVCRKDVRKVFHPKSQKDCVLVSIPSQAQVSGQQGLVHNNAILVQSEKEIRIWIRRTVVKFTRSMKEKNIQGSDFEWVQVYSDSLCLIETKAPIRIFADFANVHSSLQIYYLTYQMAKNILKISSTHS